MREKIEEIESMPNNTHADKKKLEDAWYDFIKELGVGF